MRSFVVGGPWYGSKVDVRTMMTVTELVGWARHHGYESRQIISEDTQLDLARNLLMDTAIKSRADWFVSIDADCSLHERCQHSLKLSRSTCSQCLQDDGKLGVTVQRVDAGRKARPGWLWEQRGKTELELEVVEPRWKLKKRKRA